MMKLSACYAPVMLAVGFLGGCTISPKPTISGPARMQVVRLTENQSIILDGRLDEPAWAAAPVYALSLTQSQAAAGQRLMEGGTVRLLWDDQHLYVGVELIDSDVVQEDDRDQQHHYRTGDVAEVFLKPQTPGATHSWEFYVTPNGHKTAFFLPGRGRLGLPSNLAYQSGLQVGAQVDGTLNDWRDDDRGWTAEMAIPRQELAAAGVPFTPEQSWTVMVSRYNYGRHLTTIGPELSSAPVLSKTVFHLHEEYAQILLLEAVRP